jgi:hypothetical protein
MRSKIGIGVLGVAIAFLLATNPVVVDAAGLVTSSQIKNETIKSKDIKNNQVKSVDVKDGSLTATDLAAGTIPAPVQQIKAARRWQQNNLASLPQSTLAFISTTTTISVDGNDVVLASMSMDVYGYVVSADYYTGICIRPVGTVGVPTVLGGAPGLTRDLDVYDASGQAMEVARSDSGVPAAGTYDIGSCGYHVSAGAGDVGRSNVSGWAMVIDGSGALGRPSSAAGRTSAE